MENENTKPDQDSAASPEDTKPKAEQKATIKNRLKKMGIGVILFFTIKGTITTLLMYFGFKEILERFNGC